MSREELTEYLVADVLMEEEELPETEDTVAEPLRIVPIEREKPSPAIQTVAKPIYTMEVDGYKLTYSRERGRLNIEDASMESIAIRVKDARCQSLDLEVRELSPGRHYYCEDWHMEITFNPEEESVSVILAELGLTLNFH